ncbi:c-type cytochrome [Pseudodonghicola flavimaris]|uniref:C-type cytochrome n=1 Tax=Pseudodonghicola flavimaris TaxID=3050036 RepID=A0ABT7F2T1_9RHOB|nr:c-type cytochrome [Pseudodonghicola flavimaris]MDK3018903.1 c-type cytochrome [Pseudodonghicola flavimaris]
MTRKPTSSDHIVDEKFEPWERNGRMPLPVVWVAVALAIWGTGTLLTTSGGAPETAVEAAVQQDRPVDAPDSGAALFAANCATCHQPNGSGVRLAVPPLRGSEFPAQGPELVANVLLRGIDGPIRVDGHDYDGHMPSFSAAFGDAEIAELASYVAATFGDRDDGVDTATVADLRARAVGQGTWSGGEALAAAYPGLPPQPAFSSASVTPVSADVSALIFEGRDDVWACASCHGDLGQGVENTPRLSGLSADYIAKQLRDFQTGTRANEHMSFVAKGLTEADIAGLGAYYAGLSVPSTAAPILGGDLKRGETLALVGDWDLGVPACFSCHGPSGFGVAPNFPALSAQQAPYTASQLAAWAGGHRANSPLSLMDQISKGLSTDDRRAVADYLASLPAVPAGSTGAVAKEGDGHDL